MALLYLDIERIPHIVEYAFDKVYSYIYKKRMKTCGKNVRIRPGSSVYYGLKNLSIGDDVIIPPYAHIFCTEAELKIGSKVIFGPAPTIITGNHRIDVVGRFMADVAEKLPENDKAVIIEDDVWIGANVTILMGVTIGRGSVVAAGAVVTKSCPPYSIIGGLPAKVLKYRFTNDEILQHEKSLYTEADRYTENQLKLIRP